MATDEGLRARIASLLQTAETERQIRQRVREDEMIRFADRKARFDELAVRIVAEVIRPRLQVLVDAFAHAGPMVELEGGHGLSVPFARTLEFPAHARVDACITHDSRYESGWCAFSPAIIPILMDYERDVRLGVSLESPDIAGMESFLEQGIEHFVASYLSIGTPQSIYQKDLLVTDPVCGMTLRRVDAVSTVDQDGRKVFFCADECRRQFEMAARP